MNRAIMALFGATLLILLMSATMTGIRDFRSSSQTNTFNTTTGAGVTSASLTLPLAVLDSSLIYVAASSNNTADNLVAASYSGSTLSVTGLHENDTRLITVVYRATSLDAYTAVDLAAKWWPLFLVIAIIGIVVGAVIKSFQD